MCCTAGRGPTTSRPPRRRRPSRTGWPSPPRLGGLRVHADVLPLRAVVAEHAHRILAVPDGRRSSGAGARLPRETAVRGRRRDLGHRGVERIVGMRRAVPNGLSRCRHLEHDRVSAAERVGVGVPAGAVGAGRPSQGVRAVDRPDAVPAEQRPGDAVGSWPPRATSAQGRRHARSSNQRQRSSATGVTVATSSWIRPLDDHDDPAVISGIPLLVVRRMGRRGCGPKVSAALYRCRSSAGAIVTPAGGGTTARARRRAPQKR